MYTESYRGVNELTDDILPKIQLHKSNSITIERMNARQYIYVIECCLTNPCIDTIIFGTSICYEHNNIIDMLNHQNIKHLIANCRRFNIDYMIEQLHKFKHIQTLQCYTTSIQGQNIPILAQQLKISNITNLFINIEAYDPEDVPDIKLLFVDNNLRILTFHLHYDDEQTTMDWFENFANNKTIKEFGVIITEELPQVYMDKFADAIMKNKTIKSLRFNDLSRRINIVLVDAVAVSGIKRFSTVAYDDIDTFVHLLQNKKLKAIDIDIDDDILHEYANIIRPIIETNYYIRYLTENINNIYGQYTARNQRYKKSRVFKSLIDFAIVFAGSAFDPYICAEIFNWYYDPIITDLFVVQKIAIAVGIRKSVDKIKQLN